MNVKRSDFCQRNSSSCNIVSLFPEIFFSCKSCRSYHEIPTAPNTLQYRPIVVVWARKGRMVRCESTEIKGTEVVFLFLLRRAVVSPQSTVMDMVLQERCRGFIYFWPSRTRQIYKQLQILWSNVDPTVEPVGKWARCLCSFCLNGWKLDIIPIVNIWSDVPNRDYDVGGRQLKAHFATTKSGSPSTPHCAVIPHLAQSYSVAQATPSLKFIN